MNKKLIVTIVTVLILGAIGFGVSSHKDSKPATNNSQTTNQPTPKTASATQTSAVSIQGFAFSPGDIKVKKGTSVTWTNNDSVVHTVSEVDGKKGPDSGDLAGSKTYSFSFDTVGTFHYRCNIHPDMLGTVTVTE